MHQLGYVLNAYCADMKMGAKSILLFCLYSCFVLSFATIAKSQPYCGKSGIMQEKIEREKFKLQQSNLKLAASRQFIGQTQDISRAIVSGKSPADIQSLETARDNAKSLNESELRRNEITFDHKMSMLEINRIRYCY